MFQVGLSQLPGLLYQIPIVFKTGIDRIGLPTRQSNITVASSDLRRLGSVDEKERDGSSDGCIISENDDDFDVDIDDDDLSKRAAEH